jgi:hypothetical protein
MNTFTVECSKCAMMNSVPTGAMLATAQVEVLDDHLIGAVSYICAGCEKVVSVPVTIPDFLTLLRAGVELLEEVDGDDPGHDRSPHPEDPHAGTPFTPDDLLELHELLADDTWCSALARKL